MGTAIREIDKKVQDILTSWVHPQLTARENIDYTRNPIRKPGFILKIVDGINENKIFECEVATLDEIYKICIFAGVSFNVHLPGQKISY